MHSGAFDQVKEEPGAKSKEEAENSSSCPALGTFAKLGNKEACCPCCSETRTKLWACTRKGLGNKIP